VASVTGKNRSILAGLVSDAPVTETPKIREREPAAAQPERLSARISGLARVTSGDIREKTLHLVDPARCRMWVRHNRRYDLLNEESCADLLESLRAQGEQEFPAIVRRVEGDPAFDYEVICGARRHWSVSYLRTVEHRDLKFLVEERELSDEAAFRLADIENRSRKDICDYERALDYRSAVETYYAGVARRMAERLEVSEVWLSRFLELAKLPEEVVNAFGDIRNLKENHARLIKPMLANADMRPRVLASSRKIAADQAERMARGDTVIDPPKVLELLRKAAEGEGSGATLRASPERFTNSAGQVLFTLSRKGPKKAVIELAVDSRASNADFEAAFRRAMADLRPPR
jgi:ParB family chromosome partitioning protein